VDVGALGPGLLVSDDAAATAAVTALTRARWLVIATPTYKATFTGVLKVPLDRLPATALSGSAWPAESDPVRRAPNPPPRGTVPMPGERHGDQWVAGCQSRSTRGDCFRVPG
jgi:hypothetical protein